MEARLNMLRKNIALNPEKPLAITEVEFWEYFLKFMLLRGGMELTAREIDVLAQMLSGDPDDVQLKGKNATRICSELNITPARLYHLITALKDKGIISSTGRGKRSIVPHPFIRKFQVGFKQALKEGNLDNISFIFPFKLVEDDITEGDSGFRTVLPTQEANTSKVHADQSSSI